jgi:cyclohexa-1,5-dienecarbonyl-CoA hydratase
VSDFETISLEFAGHVARLRLNALPQNVITFQMMDELRAAIEQVEQQPVASVIISGSEKAFSSGVDVAAHTPDKVEEMLRLFHSVIRSLSTCRKITIAAVQGNCLGGGAELAMVCDLVFTSPHARWGFPEIKLGCFPPVACAGLAAVVGPKHAADLILTGRQIDGTEAAAIGLANESLGTCEERAEEFARTFADLSPKALEITKKAFYCWDAFHFDKGLAKAEKVYMEELMKTEDAKEGINAFMQKRLPKWSGK